MPPFICILGTPAPPCVSLLLARQWPGASGAGPGVRLWLRARAHAGLCVRACSPHAEPGRRDPAARRLPGVPPPRSHLLAASSPGTRSVLTRHSQRPHPALAACRPPSPAQPSTAAAASPQSFLRADTFSKGYPGRWVSEAVLFLQHPPPSPYLIRAETRFSKLREEKVAAGVYYREKERGAATTVTIRFFPARCRRTD